MHEHRINPVLYVELERINGADKIMRGVVGHDGEADHAEPNREARQEVKNEIETKLILSSNFNGWNLSENLIAEKNLAEEEWEFGYAVGISRPLALAARPDACSLCPENFSAGIEVYGGLGTHEAFGLHEHVALPGHSARMGLAERSHCPSLPRFRPERRQPQVPAALGNLVRDTRFRANRPPSLQGQTVTAGPVSITRLAMIAVGAILLIQADTHASGSGARAHSWRAVMPTRLIGR